MVLITVLVGIIKIAFTLLLVIFLIALFLVLVVLFVPVKYRIEGQSVAQRADISISWLFSAIKLKLRLDSDGVDTYHTIFGIEQGYLSHLKQFSKKLSLPHRRRRKLTVIRKKVSSVVDKNDGKGKKQKNKPQMSFGKKFKRFIYVLDGVREASLIYRQSPYKKDFKRATVDYVKQMFGVLSPQTAYIYGEVGFKEPHTTGYVLAAKSLMDGFIRLDNKIKWNFEKEVMDVNCFFEGGFSLFYFIFYTIRYFLKKPVRCLLDNIFIRKEDGNE